ncbi:MAG: DUF4124 domain-containing protein [Stenotrophobium sp.]
MRFLAACLSLLFCLSALAGGSTVYRYVDKNGEVHFTDRPPSRGARPFVLDRPLDSHDAGTHTPPFQSPPFRVRINTPSPDQAYADGGGIRVAVSVMPGLANGFGMVYRVDGQPQNRKPLQAIRTTLRIATAGKHEISAALISPAGIELARSAPLTIHVRPTAAPVRVSRSGPARPQ